MLENEQLALWVAQSVKDHQLVSLALDSSQDAPASVEVRSSRDVLTYAPLALLVTSAAILIALFSVLGIRNDTTPIQDAEPALAEVTEYWIALGGTATSTETPSESGPVIPDDFESSLALDALEPQEDEDWMVRAAADFYVDLGS